MKTKRPFLSKKCLYFIIIHVIICVSLCSCSNTLKQDKLPVESYSRVEAISYVKHDFDIISESVFEPEGISSDGQFLYICDTGNDRVLKCDFDGNVVKEIGGLGSADGEFVKPRCIAVNSDSICVYDFGNKRIQLLNKEGEYVSEYVLTDWFNITSEIVDLEIDNDGTIYFSLIAFNKNLKESGVYAIYDGEPKLLKQLTVGALGKTNNSTELYYVSKYELKNNNDWVTGYAEFGTVLNGEVIIKRAVSQILSALDVAVFEDSVYVYDDCYKAIDKFSSDGIYLETVFREPVQSDFIYRGFCGDNSGNFYLSDMKNSKIYKLTSSD